MQKKLAIIGGGATGFFAGINTAEINPDLDVHIFEKGAAFLNKVKISGGGRCNVTNACYDPKELSENYPRGKKELLGPFYEFNPQHTIEWFEKRNVKLKTEEDGRIFPVSNSSQTIIDCFLTEAKKNNVKLHLQKGIRTIEAHKENKWKLDFLDASEFICDHLLIASGSSNQIWNCLQNIGHNILPPVPSLFTFNIKDNRINELMGISVPVANCAVVDTKIMTSGPLLITHWGLSGPAILKLSAWGARELHTKQYNFKLKINFIPEYSYATCFDFLHSLKKYIPKKTIQQTNELNLPSRLFKNLCQYCGINEKLNWSDISKEKMQQLAETLTESIFEVNGKSNFKDEFVTCGGIDLREVDFKTMQSKMFPHLYFAGEVLNIDAITGGFNFQAAWTTAYIAAVGISNDS